MNAIDNLYKLEANFQGSDVLPRDVLDDSAVDDDAVGVVQWAWLAMLHIIPCSLE